MAEKIWLDVPYTEKDQAKKVGARWDPAAKRWYAPREGMTVLKRWAAAPNVPELLPGEDRTLGDGLFVDLVPDSCWFTNVRSCVSPQDWERLRRMITRRAGMRCEACGATEDRQAQQWLEAHERWVYDSATRVQRLARLICLCTECHRVTHFGYAQVRGLESEALAHLIKVAKMHPLEARRHIDDAFALWRVRSSTAWALDLSILTNAGITIVCPSSSRERREVAAARIAVERGLGAPVSTPASSRTAAFSESSSRSVDNVAWPPQDDAVPIARRLVRWIMK